MYTCAHCRVLACYQEKPEKIPANCPVNDVDVYQEIRKEYQKEENSRFFTTSTRIESEGYCQWPRIREVIEFSRKMGYTKLGVAFCIGLQEEARIAANLFRKQGFTVSSVICKNGSIPKEEFGIENEEKLHPGSYEPACNPIGQAIMLNREKTDFNVVIGLCVGHDSLFFRYSEAPTTVLVAKDRVLAHNPAGALYCADSYFADRLEPADG